MMIIIIHRKVTADRSDIIIKNKKKEKLHTDIYCNNSGLRCHAKESRAEIKTQERLHKEATNAKQEVRYYTDNIWSHRMLTKALKKNLEAIPERHSIDLLQKTVTYVWKSHEGITAV